MSYVREKLWQASVVCNMHSKDVTWRSVNSCFEGVGDYSREAFISKFSKPFDNIPRACLLNRSPVPAMALKSNRSGL